MGGVCPPSLILDPLAGSGGILCNIMRVLPGVQALGSEIQDIRVNPLLYDAIDKSVTQLEHVRADVFVPPFRCCPSGDQAWCDAVLFDPPFGLRENLEVRTCDGMGKVHGMGPSCCYIDDHSGEELLQRV